MRKFSNNLSPAQVERLSLIIEEAAEVQQVACKILRHGYASTHPRGGDNNRALLENELGDLQATVAIAFAAGDIKPRAVIEAAESKMESVREYLHHQSEELLDRAAAKVGVKIT